MAITQDNLHYLAPPVKNWRILLEQSFTAFMPLLRAASALGFLGDDAIGPLISVTSVPSVSVKMCFG